MNHTKSSFIKLALDCQVLKFGEFTLKSGRLSPYFFNAGLFYHGSALRQLGQFYAQTLLENNAEFEHLFGPAYKGLPLATTTAVALDEAGQNCTVTFNRKEVKKHGEGGQLIGSPLTGKTIIIDDVITAGTAFRESQTLIKENGGILTGVIIALDRCERGLTERSTLSEIKDEGIKVYSIINLFDLIEYLSNENQPEQVKKLQAYQELYGCEQ
ncbi:orotate phosphoribosyltransferase [uncultured Legionella sp.]|uniref:orotate phosphoribosyltransferase n=1 Tax=uncultured Legionella sp. TaxID=210934 RepID=UPI0026184DA4|nr:orotate phosphoribosyltransferase [uncultured Legionella sp.]